MSYIFTLALHCGSTELYYPAGDVIGTGTSSSPARNRNSSTTGVAAVVALESSGSAGSSEGPVIGEAGEARTPASGIVATWEAGMAGEWVARERLGGRLPLPSVHAHVLLV